MGTGGDFKAKYSASALAREWGWFVGKDRRPDATKIIRSLGALGIRQHVGPGGNGRCFWLTDIKQKAPRLFEWWKERRHESAMAKLARGEAA